MPRRIDRDVKRFNSLVDNLKKKGLERYFKGGKIDAIKPSGDRLRIPIKQLELPRFKYGPNDGVGQGDGDVGDPVPGIGGQGDGEGGRGHGEGPGDHVYAEMDRLEAAEILGEELELPNLLEKFGGDLATKRQNKYTGISPVGPESLRQFRRTFQQALKREIASGEYDPLNPKIIPVREDKRYRSAREVNAPATKAAIIYLIDSSGSTMDVLPFLQNVGWWADAWIQRHYSQVDRRYIHYDHAAREVAEKEFYTIGSGGGTSMAAGLSLAKRVAKEYNEGFFNLYLIHFTDGDCSGIEITEAEIQMYRQWAGRFPDLYGDAGLEAGNSLTEYLIPRCNAVFVCEAGAFSGANLGVGPVIIEGAYSDLLSKLVEERPVLEKKLRFVSYSVEAVQEKPVELVLDTLRAWFK